MPPKPLGCILCAATSSLEVISSSTVIFLPNQVIKLLGLIFFVFYTEAKQYDRALVTLRLVDDLATSKRLITRLECAKNL
ncbi:hypothetical protein [Coleofasciculus sp. F4-SAH-05]|uniref:hypothetical protein n=1 Tax=Coleofasciculus sp. F4-SAH-05 TaxID=3069525 RepID=UPI0032F16BF9